MRIVGGMWRGRTLRAPEGRGTRPTTDRVRESMASMVLSAFDLDLSDVRVLDAFAGSGAIGFEMLSRGAQACTFVERDRKAAALVRNNARELGAGSAATIQVADALTLVERGGVTGSPFGLVALDPPYAMQAASVTRLVETLDEQGQLTEDAVVLYEHATDAPGLELSGWRQLRNKKRGTTTITLYVRQAGAEEASHEQKPDVEVASYG